MNRTAEGKSRAIRYGRVVRETGTEESPNTSLSVTDTQRATVREDCPACQDDLVIEDSERYCSACGLVVVEDRIDHGPEWRPFVDDSSGKCRVGSPLTAARHDYGLSTTFSTDSDGHGNTLSGSQQFRINRLKKWHKRTIQGSKADKILIHAFTEIPLIVSGLNLGNSLRDRACNIVRRAQKEGLFKRASVEASAAAAVYAACRVEGLPWTLDDAASYVAVSKTDVKTSYYRMNRELGLKAVPPEPKQFVPRILGELSVDISPEKRKEIFDIAKWADELNMAQSRNQAGFAGGIVYRQLKDFVTQSRIAEVTGVSENCILNSKKQVNLMFDDHRDYIPIRIYNIVENNGLSAAVRERAQTLYDEAGQPDSDHPAQSYYGTNDEEQAGRRALAAVAAACRDLEVPCRVTDLPEADETDPLVVG